MRNSTSAIIKIGHRAGDTESQLKRLALFFDEIRFVLPSHWIVKDEVISDSRRAVRKANGSYHFPNLNPFRDTLPRAFVPVEALEPRLKHTLGLLIDHGIAQEIDPTAIAFASDLEAFESVKDELGWRDYDDAHFLRLSGDLNREFSAQTAQLVTSSGHHRTLHSIVPPKVVSDSVDITSVLFSAEHTSSSPVFFDPSHHAQLAYRYEQFKSGLEKLRKTETSGLLSSELLDQFGAVTFQLSNAVISSAAIDRFTIEDILELRSVMDDNRRLFVSEHLVEATNLVQGNPWSKDVRTELQRFAQGKLATDLQKFNQAAEQRIDQLAIRRQGHLISAASAAALCAAGGLVANVVPGITPWLMALIAAAAGAAKPLTAIREDMIEAKIEEIEAGRSSIAYLASITNSLARK